jgi:hypothetical protein
MTIKNNGGIFGRNPTFNDVTIEGQLTFDGDIDVNSDLKVDGNLFVTGTGDFDGDLNVNAGSIVVDAGTVNITHPFDRALQINRSGANTFSLEHSTAEMYLYNVTTASPVINFKNNSNVHINSGNLVFGTAGNGIDFSATSGTGTSELFDDYEEGTWTPTIAAGSGTFTTVSAAGRYTKTGRMVIAQLRIFLTDSTGGSGWINISNFPFANSQASYAVAYGESPSGQMIRGTIGASSVNLFEYDNTDPVVNGNYSVTLIYEAT